MSNNCCEQTAEERMREAREPARLLLDPHHHVIDKDGFHWVRANRKADLWIGRNTTAPDSYALLWNYGPVAPVGEPIGMPR